MSDTQETKNVKETVKQKYGEIARGESSCCAPLNTSCCGGVDEKIIDLSHGYEPADLDSLPEGATMGLGCGNPLTLAEIQPGWKVLDLGSGGGVDVFLAAKKVGDEGHVTGLDMTDDMLAKARENAEKGGFTNVTFTRGDIEEMPFPDNSFDLVISNCVINLVPDKRKAYQEIHRVLKPGGMIAIADMATRGEMPEEIRKSAEAWAGCVAGALDLDNYLELVKSEGFVEVETRFENEYDFAKSEDYALLSIGLVGKKQLDS